MAQRGRGRGIGQENEENVNELIEMMMIMISRMDSIEVTERRGITHVIRDDNDDEEEVEPVREEREEQMTIEERMIRAINSIGAKPKLDIAVYSGS